MSGTKSILSETERIVANLLHHEEIANSSPENLLNFTNTLVSSIQTVNYTFTFKEATSKLDRLDFMEAKRKEICAHEIDNHWTLVIKIELNDIKTIMSIWHFNGNRYPYGRLIKQKTRLYAHRGIQQWGVSY